MQLLRDGLCSFTLQFQDVTFVAVVVLRPHMGLIAHLNQLRSNPHAVAGVADAAFQHIIHTEFLTDLADRFFRVLVRHRGRTRDHAQAIMLKSAGLRDHFLGESVADEILRGVSGQVLKRKHHQHELCRRRLLRNLTGRANENILSSKIVTTAKSPITPKTNQDVR